MIGIRGLKIDQHASGPATILVGIDDSSTHSPSAVTNAGCTVAGAASHAIKMESGEGYGTRSVPITIDEIILQDNELIFQREDRRYRIRGLEKNASLIQLKVNLVASRNGLVHLDTLDLVKARSRAAYIKAAATELYVDADTIKKDVGRLLLQLETFHGDRLAQLKQPTATPVALTDQQRRQAIELLQSPKLLQQIVADMDACGMVGEATNKLVGYLAAISRKLENPLAIEIQSASAAGKTSLMDAVLVMMPGEDVLRLSGTIGQSLFYLDSLASSATTARAVTTRERRIWERIRQGAVLFNG